MTKVEGLRGRKEPSTEKEVVVSTVKSQKCRETEETKNMRERTKISGDSNVTGVELLDPIRGVQSQSLELRQTLGLKGRGVLCCISVHDPYRVPMETPPHNNSFLFEGFKYSSCSRGKNFVKLLKGSEKRSAGSRNVSEGPGLIKVGYVGSRSKPRYE